MYTWAVKNQKKNEEEKAHWRNFLLSYLVIKKKSLRVGNFSKNVYMRCEKKTHALAHKTR